MRLRLAFVALAAAAAVLGLTGTAAQASAEDGLTLEVTSSADGPSIVLTNRGGEPCQVVDSSTGTLRLDTVEQDGKAVAPIAIVPSFDDDLGFQMSQALKTLAPGQSITTPVTIVNHPGGKAIRTVSWSPMATIGAVYPIDLAKSVRLEAAYAVPIAISAGPPLCAPAHGAGLAEPGGPAGPEPGRNLWIMVGAWAAVILIALVIIVLLLRRRRQGAAAAVAILVAAAMGATGWRQAPASATVTAGPDISGAYAGCLSSFRAPGGDPRNILPTLENPGVNVTISRSSSNGENRYDPHNIFVYWNPDNRAPFEDGVVREPCDELYHELYHAFEDTTPQGVDLHECFTADGKRWGISIKEVNATKAENERRHNQGRRERSVYGTNPLPPSPCRPSKPDDPLCHPTRGCPQPPQKPGGNSTSDPHMTTLDGRRYDFQGKGEFVVVKDTAAANPATAFQIQARQSPWTDARYVTVNTAVAANVAGDRVEARLDKGRFTLLINGVPRDLASASLPKGGAVTYTQGNYSDKITLDWPDSSYALISEYRTSITLVVWAAPQHAGKLDGLLGNGDSDPANDVPGKATYDDLYPSFADKYRITNETSLFTYASGTNTDTYTDRTFPDRYQPNPANEAWAQALCRRYGITDPISLAACIVDVANTGTADFMAAAVVSQSLSASFRIDGSETTVGIGKPGDVSTVSFEGVSGQKLYVDVVSSTLPNACGVLLLKDPTGKEIGSGCVINGRGGIDAVTLTVTGTYAIVVDPPGNATGTVELRLVTPTDQQSGLVVDGPEVTVKIAAAGAVGKLTFAGQSGQIIFVDVPSSTLKNQCGVLMLQAPDGKNLTAGCIINGDGYIDRTVLPSTGTYTVLIDPADTSTGEAKVRIMEAHDQKALIAAGSPSVNATVSQPGALAEFTFTGVAGHKYYVDVTGATLRDQCGLLSIRDSGGKVLNSGCVINGVGFVDRTEVPANGTYTIGVDPADRSTGSIALRLIEAIDQTGTIAIGGPAVTATISQAGAVARFTFTGSAGQKVTLDATASTLVNQCGLLSIRDATDKVLSNGCVINGSGGIGAVTLPAAGTYTVQVDPRDSTTGVTTLKLHT